MTSSVSSWAPRALLAGAVLAVMMPVQAAVVNLSNAAYAATFVRDCRSAGNTSGTPDRCEATPGYDGTGQTIRMTPAEIKEQLTLNGFAASVAATNPYGIVGGEATRSLIDASGAAGVLNLKQGVFTQPTGRASGHSLGLQSFFYAGATETRTIQNVFDFTSNLTPTAFNLPGVNGLYTDPVVSARARVLVFSLTSSSFSFDTSVGWDAQEDGLAGQARSGPGFRQEALLDQMLTIDGETINLSFTVEAGRYYFVQSYLGLWARFGGELDATHTFTSQLGRTVGTNGQAAFTPDTAGFTAAAPAAAPVTFNNGVLQVPEPGTLAAGALGLALLGWSRRRRG